MIALIRSLLLYARLLLAWYLLFVLLYVLADWLWRPLANLVLIAGMVTLVFVVMRTHSHLARVRTLNAGKLPATLGSRQRRQVEVPFEADAAFDLLDTTLRELPGVEHVDSARNRLEVRATLNYADPYGLAWLGQADPMGWIVSRRNRVRGSVIRGDGSSSLILVFEPVSAPWSDWLQLDDGVNLEHAKAVTHAISLAMAAQRRGEQAAAAQSATEKELAIARLNLLQAQVEPHFLYNTLANAQVLVRSDAAAADNMLGHLIQYLRHSLPRTDEALSSVGDELERSRAYLQILKIRMGSRLNLQIDVPAELLATPLPPMMLQTLVENAIKHGLEPRPGEGTVWIFARRQDNRVAITVADDGLGFQAGSGGGIGLDNVRERLKLIYGTAASLVIAANFPQGVAATISVPATATKE